MTIYTMSDSEQPEQTIPKKA
eukprot:SAG11_NODE_45381_length_145_cov_92.913043_1_plen_20_part_10